jgi:hypothetical protein
VVLELVGVVRLLEAVLVAVVLLLPPVESVAVNEWFLWLPENVWLPWLLGKPSLPVNVWLACSDRSSLSKLSTLLLASVGLSEVGIVNPLGTSVPRSDGIGASVITFWYCEYRLSAAPDLCSKADKTEETAPGFLSVGKALAAAVPVSTELMKEGSMQKLLMHSSVSAQQMKPHCRACEQEPKLAARAARGVSARRRMGFILVVWLPC